MNVLIHHGSIILLARRVENIDMDCLTINGNLSGIGVFNGWIVVTFEDVLDELKSETALSHSSIPEENHIEAWTRSGECSCLD